MLLSQQVPVNHPWIEWQCYKRISTLTLPYDAALHFDSPIPVVPEQRAIEQRIRSRRWTVSKIFRVQNSRPIFMASTLIEERIAEFKAHWSIPLPCAIYYCQNSSARRVREHIELCGHQLYNGEDLYCGLRVAGDNVCWILDVIVWHRMRRDEYK